MERKCASTKFDTKKIIKKKNTGRVTTPYLFRISGRRKTSPVTPSTTATRTTTAPKTSSRPTKVTRRKYPAPSTTKTLESQESTTQKPTDSRYRFVSRKPFFRSTTPKNLLETTRISNIDQTRESSNQQSLEEDYDENGTTELGDIAAALNVIQKAPLPGKIPTTSVRTTPPLRIISTSIPTRSRIKYTTHTPTFPPTTKKFIIRRPPQAFEKINPSVQANTFRPLAEYDYYDDNVGSIIARIPEHSKVLLHSNGVIECLDQGNFPHPVSCKKFISCAKMENGNVLGWEYTCPVNLSFDPIGGMCNWSAGLGCNEK